MKGRKLYELIYKYFIKFHYTNRFNWYYTFYMVVINKRKQEKFFNWIGLKKIKKEQLKAIICRTLIVIIAFLLLSIYMIFITKDISTATSQFDGLGLKGLISAIIYSFVQTSFTEEIFFRGFILKRVKNKFGFTTANIIQSILFALLHCAMFFTLTSILNVILITLFTGLIALAMGYINEKESDGSIYPSWCIHGIANLFSSIVALFNII